MKSLLSSPFFVAIGGWLIWLWMVTTSATVRWTVEGEPLAREEWGRGTGAILASWHRGVLLMPSGWRRHVRTWPGKPPTLAMLVSLSRDALYTTRACEILGLDIIKGSSANPKKANKDKGGARAAVELTKYLRDDGCVCITLDGPRGPPEEVGLGAIMIAQRVGSGILPYAIAAAPIVRLNTWEKLMLPLPFTRGAIVFGPMLFPSRDDVLEDLQAELQRRMDTVTARADEIVGLPRIVHPPSAAT